jgi:predicted dehydrogenase
MASDGMTRRRFLKRASAGTVLAGMSFDAASYARISGAGERFVLGLIGCGGRGQDLMEYFAKQGAEFSVVCDPDESRIQQARAVTKGNAETVKDFRKLLEFKEIDAVVVATPDHWHALPTILACDAGKDVYVEKPLAYSVREGRAMVEAALRTRRIVQIGTQQRAGEHYRRAIEFVRQGGLGKVTRARVWNVWNNALGSGGGRWGEIGNPPDSEPPL